MSEEITVIAIIKAKDGLTEQVEQELLALIEPTRAEQGCITYQLNKDVQEPGKFVFYEQWKSRQALDEHLNKPHLQALIAKADQLFAEPLDVTICKKIC